MARLPVAGPVVIPNCAEVKLFWSFAGRTFANVLHGNLTAAGPLSPGIAESIFSNLKGAAGTTAWLLRLNNGVSFSGVSVKDLRAPNNPAILSTGAATLGTGTGNAMPINTALVITLTTGSSGPGYRGRVYLGGMTTTQCTDGKTFISACSTDGIGFVTAVNAAMTAQGLPLVVAQHALNAGTHHDGSQWAARPAGVTPVTNIVQRNLRVDTQRRRTGR